MTQTNRQILLVEKPTGKLLPQNFKMAEAAIPEPQDGEVLLRVLYISLDAANRAWMQGATYRAAVEANTVMAGGALDFTTSAIWCSAIPAGRTTPWCAQGTWSRCRASTRSPIC